MRKSVGNIVTRAYNRWTRDGLTGTLTKISSDSKLTDEAYFYRDVPKEFRIFFPRVISSIYDFEKNEQSLTLELYDYYNLGEYLRGTVQGLSKYEWQDVLELLYKIITLWEAFKFPTNPSDAEKMYYEKTEREYNNFKAQFPNSSLFRKDILRLNDNEIYNLHILFPDIKKFVRNVLVPTYTSSFMHGDLGFCNILYGHSVLRFVDPRGSFGNQGVYGDSRYDIAKLYHSVDGRYDYLNNNEFEIKETSYGNFTFSVPSSYTDTGVLNQFKEMFFKKFDEKQITMIEGLIFVGACARHYENPERQLALYLTGIDRLNRALSL